MPDNALVELNQKLPPAPEVGGLELLQAWKRTLDVAGQAYAREVQRGVRSILGAADQFKEGWELCRRKVLEGRTSEVQDCRDRFLRAFEERLAHLREAYELIQFASRVAASELPETRELATEIAP